MKDGVISGVTGIIGVVVGAVITLYVQNAVDLGKDIYTADYKINSVNERFNENQNTGIPVEKLIYDGVDWNNVFLDINDKKTLNTYYKLCSLDELRDKILATDNNEDKSRLIAEYWDTFKTMKQNHEIQYLLEQIDKQNNKIESHNKSSVTQNASSVKFN